MLTEELINCKADNKLLILDCCSANTALKELNLSASEKYLILTASEHLEKSKEIEELKSGFLTYQIHKALTEKKTETCNNSGVIFINNLFEWLLNETKTYNQTRASQVPLPNLLGNQKINFEIAKFKNNTDVTVQHSSNKYFVSNLVNNITNSEQDFSLYRLVEPNWYDMINEIDFPREIINYLFERIIQPLNEIEFIPIVGISGIGKSTLLKRIAYSLYINNKPTYFFDGKSINTSADDVLYEILDSENNNERIFVFCDNAINLNAWQFLDMMHTFGKSKKVSFIASYQPNEYDRSLGTRRETILLGDDKRNPFEIKNISNEERKSLVKFLMQKGAISDSPESVLINNSLITFELIFDELFEDARIEFRVENILARIKSFPVLKSLLDLVSITFSIGVPLPINQAVLSLQSFYKNENIDIDSYESITSYQILTSEDSFRITHEKIARAITAKITSFQLEHYLKILLLSTCDTSNISENFLVNFCKSIFLRLDNSFKTESFYKSIRKLIINAEFIKSFEQNITQTQSVKIALSYITLRYILDIQDSQSYKFFSNFCKITKNNYPPSINNLFLSETANLLDEKQLELNEVCRFVLGVNQDNYTNLITVFHSRLIRLIFSDRANGRATVLMCLSKFRKFNEIIDFLDINIDECLIEERLLHFTIEIARQSNNYDLLQRVLKKVINAEQLKYRYIQSSLARCSIKWSSVSMSSNTLSSTLTEQIEWEKKIILKNYDVDIYLIKEPLWKALFMMHQKISGISDVRPKLVPLISQRQIFTASDIVSCELIVETLKFHISSIELCIILNHGLKVADKFNYPALFFWNEKDNAREILLQFISTQNKFHSLKLVSATMFKLEALFSDKEFGEISQKLINSCLDFNSKEDIHNYFTCVAAMRSNDNTTAINLWGKLDDFMKKDHGIFSQYANFVADILEDLDKSINIYSEIIENYKIGYIEKSRYFNNIGRLFFKQYTKTKKSSDYIKAKEYFDDAILYNRDNIWAKKNLQELLSKNS